MGDVADDILDGQQCQYCGQVFIEPYGYPVTCQQCQDYQDNETTKNEITRSTKRPHGRN